MHGGEIITRLNHLIQVDIDAINAYSQAILALEPGPVRDRLSAFRADHERHVADLSDIVREHGGAPRESRDLLGFLVEGFTAVSSALGGTAALTAMRSNEELTSRTYERAMTLDLPSEAKAIVARNYEDELRHRDYLAQQLRSG